MRLLIVTQTVDPEDQALGFFCGWIEKLSPQTVKTTVICLREGKHALPATIGVHSLGKGLLRTTDYGLRTRVRYCLRFWYLVWALRHEYDTVFVHMNQEYVLLGGLLWNLMGKRVVMWRNHKKGSWLTDLACMLSDSVCYTSPDSYVAHKDRSHRMPIGIDTTLFHPAETSAPAGSILFLGRFDVVKKVKEFAQALCVLAEANVVFHADIVGSPTYPDSTYPAEVRAVLKDLKTRGIVSFSAGVAHAEVPVAYRSHAIYVNVTPSGSFDKTIGEAMASGCVVVTANAAVREAIPEALFVQSEPTDIARGIAAALDLSESGRQAVARESREWIEREHSLSLLVEKLETVLTS